LSFERVEVPPGFSFGNHTKILEETPKIGFFSRRGLLPPGSSFGNHPKSKPFRGRGVPTWPPLPGVIENVKGQPKIPWNTLSDALLTPSAALNLVPRNSFRKLSNFQKHFAQLYKYLRGANFEKHADPEKRIETVANHVRIPLETT